MPRLTLTTHVDAPLERTFAAFTDLENAAQNISGIARLDILTDGPTGKGTRFRETRIMFKKEAVETMEITAFDPPSAYVIEADTCGAHCRIEFRFVSESANRTRVEVEVTMKAVTFLAKIMTPLSVLMMGMMRKCMEQDLLDMKRVAESQTAPIGEANQAIPTGQAG